MEENIDTLDQTGAQPNKRPTFLTVLCILTFVGSGLGILGALNGLFITTPADSFEAFEQIGDQGMDYMVPDRAEFLKWSMYTNVSNLIASLMCLGGALLIWRQQKTGFFVYTGGWLLSIIMSVFATQFVLGPGLAWVVPIAIAFNVLLMIAFLVMYGVNLKHMK
jgi:hypothetical protein